MTIVNIDCTIDFYKRHRSRENLIAVARSLNGEC